MVTAPPTKKHSAKILLPWLNEGVLRCTLVSIRNHTCVQSVLQKKDELKRYLAGFVSSLGSSTL